MLNECQTSKYPYKCQIDGTEKLLEILVNAVSKFIYSQYILFALIYLLSPTNFYHENQIRVEYHTD